MYREDSLPLLGTPMIDQTPETFFSYICSLEDSRSRHKKKKILPLIGKVIKVACKTKPGIYGIEDLLSQKRLQIKYFLHPKSLQITEAALIAAFPERSIYMIREFLEKKKFSLAQALPTS